MDARIKVGLGVTAAAVLTLSGTGSASAAQGYIPLECSDGSSIVVRVPDSHSSDKGGWSVGQVVDGGSGHLIPTSFAFTLYDVTTESTVFSDQQAKGGGHANRRQTSVTCSNTDSGTAGDLFGSDLPPGVSADDTVTVTISVEAVVKP
jgi:hypothetical protein